MDNCEDIYAQIKMLCASVTENTYEKGVQQGYEMLVRLHDLGAEEDCVYQSLLQLDSSLDNGLSCDCLADIMDFVTGWCPPQKRIWKMPC